MYASYWPYTMHLTMCVMDYFAIGCLVKRIKYSGLKKLMDSPTPQN
jgi:hypothetical protein